MVYVELQNYVLKQGREYFGKNARLLKQMKSSETDKKFFPGFTNVTLPLWANGIGISSENYILIPSYCCTKSVDEASWEDCDWFTAAFSLMTGETEEWFELNNGCIHSYSSKLPSWFHPAFERAWVNRIFLFLRRWYAVKNNIDETAVFGPVPIARLYLTHDVDAVSKTNILKMKRISLDIFNSLHLLKRKRFNDVVEKLRKTWRYSVRGNTYDYFDHIMRLEKKHSRSSIFFIYSKIKRDPINAVLSYVFDPSYDLNKSQTRYLIQKVRSNGGKIGLHQSFLSWNRKGKTDAELQHLSSSFSTGVVACRQHWLRFSWQETWATQANAGLTFDFTLGFNDRPGFRNSAALKMQVINRQLGTKNRKFYSIPMLLMDQHLFDHQTLSVDEQRKQIDHFLQELKDVGGVASVNWHHRVFDKADYGWGSIYGYLLRKSDEIGISQPPAFG